MQYALALGYTGTCFGLVKFTAAYLSAWVTRVRVDLFIEQYSAVDKLRAYRNAYFAVEEICKMQAWGCQPFRTAWILMQSRCLPYVSRKTS